MSLIDKLRELERTDPEGFALLRQIAASARNTELDPEKRLMCAAVIGEVGSKLIMDDIRSYFKPPEPRYETRFVRGAKTRVRVD